MTHREQLEKAYDYGYNNPDAEVEQFIHEHATWGSGDIVLLAYQFLHGQTCRAIADRPPHSVQNHNNRRITDAIQHAANN